MVIIKNKANTVELDFNDYATVFKAAKISIDKGAGNRLYLSANKTYIELIYSADGEKVVLDSGTYPIFEKEDSASEPHIKLYRLKLIFQDHEKIKFDKI